jgi:SAM-dependent methyltransferase
VLDVGSGTGALAAAIAERDKGAQVVGIDPSKEYVAYAGDRNRFRDRARFEVGDAQQMHFHEGSFDAALSLLVFNFIPDAKKALLEVRRVCKPGSKVSAAVWDYGAGMKMLRIFWDAVVQTDPPADKLDEKHMPLCREGELSSLWKQGGLENVHEEPLEITMKYASFADFWDPFLLGQGPVGAYVRRLTPEKVAALHGEVKRRLAVQAEDRPFTLTARVWAVRGMVPKR